MRETPSPYVETDPLPKPARGALRLVTWNINSVRLRLPLVAKLVAQAQPDILCLQETKCPDDQFPHGGLAELGFAHRYAHGMKSYNGVAILSRVPIAAPAPLHHCGREDCRHASAELPGGIALHNVYVPAGGDVPDPVANDKFKHKLDFVAAQTVLWKKRGSGRPAILVGDLNIAPCETDVWSHKQLLDVVSHTPVETAAMGGMMQAGAWHDALRHFVPADQKLYTWWSYRAADWRASDRGRRLDHVWVSQDLAGGLRSHTVLKDARGWEKASDHVPVLVEIAT
jgi:exodeoxyribonuclease-3